MENRGLLFIPDISGFSRFISETEIGHSRLIIQELLEILINANDIGLEISEIEGDAILFYKFGSPPELEQLYRQVEKMFCAFHSTLLAYEQHRYCQCKACSSANTLSLKVITHYGEFTGYNIKNFHKLIGKDLIVAHQLLKNDIPQHEYWLITGNLSGGPQPEGFAQWMHWNSSVKQTEAGAVPFHYTQLSHLRKELSPDHSFHSLVLEKKVKVFSLEKIVDTDIITLFHATGDFQYRNRWQEGVRKVEVVDHFLPRVGMKCRCIHDHGETIIYSSSYVFRPDKIEFSETDEGKNNATYYTLQRLAPKKTKLTLDFYLRKNFGDELLFNLLKKKKLKSSFHRSLENLAGMAKELKIASAVSE